MRRRHALQIGAALALLPLTGCGAPEPAKAPTPAGPDPDTIAPVSKANGDAEAGAKAAGGDAPAAPGEASEAAAKEAPAPSEADAGLRRSFTRVNGRVGRNHGHVFEVPFADVQAGAEKTYELAAAAGHRHTVTLSADEMKRLLAGQLLRTKSTTDRGHSHRLVARCAPPVDPPEWVNVCKFSSSGQDEHEIVITAADYAAQAEKTYDIQGLAGHAHTVTLSAADFKKLAANGPVTLHSTRDADDAHLHTVTIEHPAKKA